MSLFTHNLFPNPSGETLNSIRGVAEDFRDNIDAIEDADPDNFVIEQQTIDDMRAVVTEIENNAEAIDNDVNDVNLDEFDEFTDRSMFHCRVNMRNNCRYYLD